MSDMKNKMAALSGGGAVDLMKTIARSPADGGGQGGSGGTPAQLPKLDARISLG